MCVCVCVYMSSHNALTGLQLLNVWINMIDYVFWIWGLHTPQWHYQLSIIFIENEAKEKKLTSL